MFQKVLSSRIGAIAGMVTLASSIGGCAISSSEQQAASYQPAESFANIGPLTCDDSIKTAFKPDPQTEVLLVKAFSRGERLELPGDVGAPSAKASADVCMVKLNVGPGSTDKAGAPSSSAGIGIEIWLPNHDQWNQRIHAMGGGGWQGGTGGAVDHVANPHAAGIAMSEGAVSSSTDTGHASIPKTYGIPESNGDFAMRSDGSINEALWHDFAERAIHEQAVKTKALTAAFYGKPARYSYWDGSSTGGRQGHKLAQAFPGDFDGIVANMPALHWTNLLTGMGYPHIVYQNDLDGKSLSKEQLDLVSNAAIAACDQVGGEHLGYILDPSTCTYDPTKDQEVLCQADGGNNTTAACLTPKQALAVNKIWYGATADGSVPDPAVDNGWQKPVEGKRLWYGVARGTSLWNAFFTRMMRSPSGVANPEQPNFLSTDQIALSLKDASYAGKDFKNDSTGVREQWKTLSYAEFANVFAEGKRLNNKAFSNINTDNPDLSAFKAKGGKLLLWHGTNDEVIPLQGSTTYYDSVVETMGGLDPVQDFYRLYVVPGVGHHSPNGTANVKANPPLFRQTGMYELLVKWVEEGEAPGRVDISSIRKPQISQPVCPYPQKARYVSGDPKLASSFQCR